jgi:hypothetical protein
MDSGSSETRVGSASSRPIDAGGFAPGTILADRYRIVSLAGRGGMGEVYRADDLRLGQPVALKFLPKSLEGDAAARERLLAEVRSARTVSHPNVCRVYDVVELGGPALSERTAPGESKGRVFLTMEYIDGEDLASLLRRIGKLPAAKALEVARQLCAGLSAAHEKGLLHRDLKPANVMIDGRGQARIADFGLALRLADDVDPTRPGQAAGVGRGVTDMAGTLAYMAPERFAGKPATVQSDLYALGLILYETYTGKPAFKANTVLEWERAHSDSTPTSPSALASDIEPTVERAILRCLEKDPARRPASAAQVAAALPGGDPLAAAIAAGETPSPELVAASGEVGTLPRWQAWSWLVACLAALAVLPFTYLPFAVTEHVAFDLSPDALQVKAREVLQRLGYSDQPADRAWWFRADEEDVARVSSMRPGEAAAELRRAAPGPLRFCYRQSPATMVPTGIWRMVGISVLGTVSATDPIPTAGDAYLELDPAGRLVGLRVVPPVFGAPQPTTGVNWAALFDAAGLGTPGAFAPVAPRWWPDGAADARDAREGVYAGERVRVEAAARAGRPVFFRVLMPWNAPARNSWTLVKPGPDLTNASSTASTLLGWTVVIALAVVARRNIALGRVARTGARRVAIGAMLVQAVGAALVAHPSIGLAADVLPQALFLGLLAWLSYVGLEPAARRTWPHLLIASTRLVEGRWRDPLVGRAVLVGVLVGIFNAAPYSLMLLRLLDLNGSGPILGSYSDSFAGGWSFAGSVILVGATSLVMTQTLLGLLIVARLVARRATVAWVIFAGTLLVCVFLTIRDTRSSAISSWLLLPAAAWATMLWIWVFWRHGALALATSWCVYYIALLAPWTRDLSRWYAWRQWVVVAVIAGLAFWGFRNVLGKQSAFPSGALDG